MKAGGRMVIKHREEETCVPEQKDANKDWSCGNLKKIQELQAIRTSEGRNGLIWKDKVQLKSLGR